MGSNSETMRFLQNPSGCICVPTHSHEAVLPLALLQRVLNEAAQLEEEQLLGGLGRGAGPFGLTVLFTQRLGVRVA